MEVPSIKLAFETKCTPQPLHVAGKPAFKPYAEVTIDMPEISRVVFDPDTNMPREGRISCKAMARGNVMESLSSLSVDAKLKTNSPRGSLVLQNVSNGHEAVL